MQSAESDPGHARREVCPECEARCCAVHCSAANKQPDLYGPWCGNRKGFKTNHFGVGPCFTHTGNTPAAVKSARRLLAQKALAVHLRDLVYEPLGDPVLELADVAAKWRTLADWALAQAAELDTKDAGPMLELAVELGKQARGALSDCGRLGLEERRVRLDEARFAAAIALVRKVLVLAGLDPDSAAVKDWIEAAATELEEAGSAHD